MGLWCMTLECYFKNVSISTVYSKVDPVELDFQLMISFLTTSELETGHKLKSCHIGPIKGASNFPDPYSYAGIILFQTGPTPCWRNQNPVQIFSLKSIAKDLRFITLCRLWLHSIILWGTKSERFLNGKSKNWTRNVLWKSFATVPSVFNRLRDNLS